MKHYLVKLDLIMGNVKKATKHLVKSYDERSAGIMALEAECHDTPDFGEFPCKTACWDMGEYVYRVFSCTELDQATYDILRKYL